MQIRWAARRTEAADGAGSDGGAWMDGDAARATACDAAIAPVVTSEVDRGALDDLVRLCLQLTRHGPCRQSQQGAAPTDADPAAPTDPGPAGPDQVSGMSREAIQQAIIGKTTAVLLHSQ
jgi:hypothetical protein